jgi:hypothetical protein
MVYVIVPNARHERKGSRQYLPYEIKSWQVGRRNLARSVGGIIGERWHAAIEGAIE